MRSTRHPKKNLKFSSFEFQTFLLKEHSKFTRQIFTCKILCASCFFRVNEIIANARIWRNFPYATPKHIANAIVEKKFGSSFCWSTSGPFFSTITFATWFVVAYWRSRNAELRKPNYDKFRQISTLILWEILQRVLYVYAQ